MRESYDSSIVQRGFLPSRDPSYYFRNVDFGISQVKDVFIYDVDKKLSLASFITITSST